MADALECSLPNLLFSWDLIEIVPEIVPGIVPEIVLEIVPEGLRPQPPPLRMAFGEGALTVAILPQPNPPSHCSGHLLG